MEKRYDLTAVHQANLKILKEIDRICRAHGITYGLDAGTLIGAVRHQALSPGMTMGMWHLPGRTTKNLPRRPGESCPDG